LSDICTIKTGKKDVNEGNPKGAYPFFTCAKKPTYCDSYSFDCEAILIAGNGEVGHCQKYSGKFEAYQRTYVLSNFMCNSDYLFAFLNSFFQIYVNSKKQTGAMPYIKLGMLENYTIPILSLLEQQKIANFLNSIDKFIELKEKEIVKAEEWKVGLTQKLFI
jgi:type I restriction enzyme S subunit